jgi:NAD+ synthase (glutamine-hydrolysing)
VNINASPFREGKRTSGHDLGTGAGARVVVTYTNTVGGQDELVFDGQSMVIDRNGKLLAIGRQFEEELMTVDIRVPALSRRFPKT